MEEEINIESSEELSQDEWWLILWSFITDIPEQEWNEFSQNLIYKDRFSSSHKVIDTIKGLSGKCTETIKKGQVLYRARIYYKDPLRQFLSDIFMDTSVYNIRDNQVINDFYNMQLAALIMAVKNGHSRKKEILDAYSKWQRKRFKGYNSLESAAPPAEIATPGRLNPEKIRYLYLAEDPETAIYEVRPTIGQHVSVATFKTIDEVKIYNL